MQKRIKLKLLRIANDLNQVEMAKKCKVDRSSYCFIEMGQRDGSLDFWLNVKTKFNLSLNEVWAMMYESKE